MNMYYAKAALYAYPNLCDASLNLKDLIVKKALYSRNDLRPADTQCEEIIQMQALRMALMNLKRMIDQVLSRFDQVELDSLDRRYFKQKPQKYYDEINFDYSSRKYFRDLLKIEKRFAARLERLGADDKWFELECKDFISDYVNVVIEHENNHRRKWSKKTQEV